MSNELTIVGNVGETIELHNLPGGAPRSTHPVPAQRIPAAPRTPGTGGTAGGPALAAGIPAGTGVPHPVHHRPAPVLTRNTLGVTMTTNSQPTSYNDLKRLAGEALTQAVTEVKNSPTLSARLTTLETAYDTSTEAVANRLKEHTEELKAHTEALKAANRRANWQDQRIAELSDKLRNTQIWLTCSFALIIILATFVSSFFH